MPLFQSPLPFVITLPDMYARTEQMERTPEYLKNKEWYIILPSTLPYTYHTRNYLV